MKLTEYFRNIFTPKFTDLPPGQYRLNGQTFNVPFSFVGITWGERLTLEKSRLKLSLGESVDWLYILTGQNTEEWLAAGPEAATVANQIVIDFTTWFANPPVLEGFDEIPLTGPYPKEVGQIPVGAYHHTLHIIRDIITKTEAGTYTFIDELETWERVYKHAVYGFRLKSAYDIDEVEAIDISNVPAWEVQRFVSFFIQVVNRWSDGISKRQAAALTNLKKQRRDFQNWRKNTGRS